MGGPVPSGGSGYPTGARRRPRLLLPAGVSPGLVQAAAEMHGAHHGGLSSTASAGVVHSKSTRVSNSEFPTMLPMAGCGVLQTRTRILHAIRKL